MNEGRTRLKVLRAMREVTQLQVAKAAGLSASRYWQIENGFGSIPSPDEQAAVAAALAVSAAEIEWPLNEPVAHKAAS